MLFRNKRWRVYAQILLLLPIGYGPSCCVANAALAVEDSDLIRASIIEKIARFITWPEWGGEQFTLCASAKAPLLPAIQNYYANETLANKPVKLLVFEKAADVAECQVVYVNVELKDQLPTIVETVQNQPVLLVVENKNAAEQGAHIDFFIDNNKINLEVNRNALNKSGLSASYHLLKVANLVGPN